MLIRLVSYASRLEHVSMALLHPVLLAAMTRGVLYVDDGWQTLNDALLAVAQQAGVHIRTQSRLTTLDGLPGPVVLCVTPQAVRRLIPEWQSTR
ncbi:MAG: phytoene dehydrogenase-like protein [Myxococcota bacterium]|jgi:phytoene dehydrogenase-like protein